MPTFMLKCPIIFNFKSVSPEMRNIFELQLEKRLDFIQEIIMNRQINREKDHRCIRSFFKRNILNPFLKLLAPTIGRAYLNKAFYIDSKCTGCGSCQRVYPAEKISMENGKPVWRKDIQCLFCFACINYCPVKAIQIKGTKTATRGRYHHAEVSAKDIAEQKRSFEK
jgi:formate hydrogenlyase subunit 6/NADH:ubiquinone oxidoreductase subunit I